MATDPYTPHLPRPDLFPGQLVHVNARTAWHAATVLSVAHAAIGVALTSTAHSPLTRMVAPWAVRPADGHRLEPVRDLHTGDEVAAGDGHVHTVAAPPWQGRDGWWVIAYTNGERAALPPGTVLRVADPTPQVTVCGTPLTSPRR